MNKKYKVGMYLIDDTDLVYKIIEVFSNSVATQPIDRCPNQSCEIITFTVIENEKWQLLAKI
jgi:hypothetical protein